MDILGTDKAPYDIHNSGFFTHVTHSWITNAGIRDAILELIEYPTLYHLILLLENDDVINSIKNRGDGYSLQVDKSSKRLLAIPSFIRHIQNNTCTISSGIADITNYSHGDLIEFTKTHHFKVDYDFDTALSSGIRHNMISEDDTREISYRSDHVRRFRDSVGYRFSDFPELKGASAEAFDTYDLELRTWCSIIGLDDILRSRDEHTYDVENSRYSKLVLAHNKFMFGVFYHTMNTVKAREIILKHLKNLDGNGVYNDMKVHYEDVNSVIRIQRQQNLISSLHSTIPSDYSAHNISDLISQWMTSYNKYIAMNNPPPHNKLLMLEHHIGNIKELRDVSTMYGMLSVSNSPYRSINDDDIIQLYYRQALLADTLRKSLIISRRKQFVHELRGIDDSWSEDGYTRIDMNMASLVDASISDDTYYIEYMRTLKSSSTMPKVAWYSLTKIERERWDGFSDEAKAIILGARSGYVHPHYSSRAIQEDDNLVSVRRYTRRMPSTTTTTVNSTEIIQHDDRHEHDDDTQSEVNICEAIIVHLTALTDYVPPFQMSRFLSQSCPGRSKPRLTYTKPVVKKPVPNKLLTPAEISSTLLTPDTIMSTTLPCATIQCNNAESVSFDEDHFRGCYKVSSAVQQSSRMGLMDRGANGSLAGSKDIRIISTTGEYIDVQGIDNHTLNKIPLGTVGCVVTTQRGEVLLILHQYAIMKRGKTIHSCIQWEAFGNTVCEKSLSFGGRQSVVTPCGYHIPLDIINGLAYVTSRPFTDDEFDNLPHVHMTDDSKWRPSALDSIISSDDTWFKDQPNDLPPIPGFSLTGEFVNANSTTVQPSPCATLPDIQLTVADDDISGSMMEYFSTYIHDVTGISLHATITKASLPDCNTLRRFLLNVPVDVVRRTLDATTQYYRCAPFLGRLKKMYKSHAPAANVSRRSEAVASDTFFFDVVAWGGVRCCQFFIGRRSLFMSFYGMKTDGEFVNTLEDEIRKRGAMDKIITDRAKAEISNRVKQILRALHIDDHQSEPHHQNQNYAERYIQEAKKYANWILNTSGAPPEAIMLVLFYIGYIWNRTARKVIGWRTPCEALTGQTPDISVVLRYRFWQPVYIADNNNGFPSESTEIMCRFAGFSESVGNDACYIVYNEDTKELLHRSEIRAACDDDANHRGNPPEYVADKDIATNDPPHDGPNPIPADDDEKGQTNHIRDNVNDDGTRSKPVIIPPDVIDNIVGRSFLMPTKADGTRERAKVVELITAFENERDNRPEHIKFKCSVGDKEYEEIVSYNEMVDFIEEQELNEDGTWSFRDIKGHSKVQGSAVVKVLVEWESGEITWEPLTSMMKTNPWIMAEYALNNDLVELWSKRYPSLKLHRYTKNAKKVIRSVNAAKRTSYKNAPVYMYGHQVPRNHQQAVQLDLENGNTKWQDSEKLERDQLWEYDTFDDRGHKSRATLPGPGYKKITLHFVYAVKHDGRYKSRIVAGGHLTDAPVESVYSGVVSLRGVRFVIFLAELNELEVWQTDVGNAYLEAYTKEKVFVIAGPEFAEREGNVLVIVRALYGLKSSGLRWYERFAKVLRNMEFFPCPAEPEIWMRACNSDGSVIPIDKERYIERKSTMESPPTKSDDGSYYEYIAVYCDDLTIASRDPEAIIKVLEGPENRFKLKGTGPLTFLLGCDYFYDEQGLLCFAPKKYIEKMDSTFRQMFGEKPPGRPRSPLEKGDNPELDTSAFLDEAGIKKYQSMIGAAQWVINLGRFDIAVHVMSMSSFRVQPRIGHLERMKRIYAYLINYNTSTIRIRTELPDISDFNFFEYDWSNSAYAGAREEIPSNLPTPRGKPVLMTSFVDANLYHDALSGKSVTGVLHFFNKTPLDWFSKKQNTVESATYGSENNAARAAIEQIRANKLTLMYLGVPLAGVPILLGDNESVVNSGTLPHGKLHKRHLMLSYHFVRENIAAGALRFAFVNGEFNPADVLSKHWGFQAVYPLLKPILFTKGDTMEAIVSDDEDHPAKRIKS